MKLVETTPIPSFDLPLAELRAQLRLGTGFDDDDVQDGVLEQAIRGALAAIEARTGKVLYARGFRWKLNAWRCPSVQALPVAPVTSVTAVSLMSRGGDVTPVDLADVYLEEDAHRPLLHASGSALPNIPVAGSVEVSFVAGFSPDWAGMPPDLAQAVLLLAAHYYEMRHEQPMNDGNMPYGVTGLIERYRTVRIIGGAVA